MRRSLLGIVLLAVLAAAGHAVPAGAAVDHLAIAEAGGAAFPDRAYVLTLPEVRALRAQDVDLTENGKPVRDLRISSGGRTAVVLAIDTSNSMHGDAIVDAMAAAREFVRQRRPEQKVGVVFFSRESRVALKPTTNVDEITRVLAAPPPLSKGTRLYDATHASLELLKGAGLNTGSVVVLSDGADVGSQADPASIAADAKAAKARVFAVGLRSSGSFTSDTLESVVTPGGSYTEATTSKALATIFSRLGSQLANEYLVTYRSEFPLESRVVVAVQVAGFPDVATAAYQTPKFPSAAKFSQVEGSTWRSTAATVVVVALVGLLLAFGLWMLVRPTRRTVAERIVSFSKAGRRPGGRLHRAEPGVVLEAVERRLERLKPWQAFELDVELSDLRWTPIRIAAVALLGTLALFTLLGPLAGAWLAAVVTLIATPVVTRIVIKYLADRVRRRFEEQLPDNLQVLASGLRAGHSFVGGLTVMVNDAPEPSKTEYDRVLHDEQLGVPIEDSLNVVAERMKCEDVVYIGLIATLQRETGGNTAEVLDRVVETMRERGRIRRLVRTLTAQGRLGGWIVTALPIAMIVFLNVFRPNYMKPMTDKFIGWVILGIAACMVIAGAYAIRRIVDIKV